MVILKFGGTSVADAGPIGQAAAIVARTPGPKVVVVSALAGVTDRLLQAARLAADGRLEAARGVLARLVDRHRRLADALAGPGAPDLQKWIGRCTEEVDALAGAAAVLRDLPPRFLDAIAAAGELLSSRLVAAAFERAGVLASWVDARHVIVTDAEHTAATPLLDPTAARLDAALRPLFAAGRVPVLGGFIGATAEGVTTTLGRGGSDFTAAVVGACLGAREIQIWTDVDGLLTADPRIVPGAVAVERLSFAEARELAYFGAKVLHPATIEPAVLRGIPVRILNSRRPEAPGTLVDGRRAAGRGAPAALACRRPLVAVEIASRGTLRPAAFLRHVFETFDRARLQPAIATGADGLVLAAVDDGERARRLAALLSDHARLELRPGMALLCAVGDDLLDDPRLVVEALAALDGIPVRAVGQPPSGRSVTVLLEEADLARAMTRLHDRFFAGRAAGAAAAIGEPA
jgi:aspartate kinase